MCARLELMWRRLWLALWLVVGLAPAHALTVQGHDAQVDLWPVVTYLHDPDQRLDLAQVLTTRAGFEPPRTAHATLGLHAGAVWLRMPFQLAPHSPRDWVVDINSAGPNRVDLYLVQQGRLHTQALLGNMHKRERASRSLAHAVQLEPGQDYELILRVEATGALILPVTLNTQEGFLTHALREQLLQGLLLGLMACLVVYSLIQGLSFRDPFFFKYTLVVLGGFGYSLVQFGIGSQYIWHDNAWLHIHMGPLSGMVSALGFFLFFEHVLTDAAPGRLFKRVMHAGAAATLVLMVLYASDLLSTHAIGLPLTVLSLSPGLIALPRALRLVRRGDPMGIYFLLAMIVYFVATATMAAVVFGKLGVNFWTHHSIQLSAMLDALLLGRLLGLRSNLARQQAQRAALERDAMRSLALTDPLTGLPNRRGLNDNLNTLLLQATPQQILAIYALDLDGFKPVNDRFGHDVGDELLVAVAARLQSLVRHNDVVARVGGDEFVVLASALQHTEHARELGQKLLDAFHEPFELAGHPCQVGLTIGYALAPLDGNDPRALLKLADEGLYNGKQAGKHCLKRLPRDWANLSLSA